MEGPLVNAIAASSAGPGRAAGRRGTSYVDFRANARDAQRVADAASCRAKRLAAPYLFLSHLRRRGELDTPPGNEKETTKEAPLPHPEDSTRYGDHLIGIVRDTVRTVPEGYRVRYSGRSASSPPHRGPWWKERCAILQIGAISSSFGILCARWSRLLVARRSRSPSPQLRAHGRSASRSTPNLTIAALAWPRADYCHLFPFLLREIWRASRGWRWPLRRALATWQAVLFVSRRSRRLP